MNLLTKVQWSLYSCFFIIYIFFGGTVFMLLEQQNELDAQKRLISLRTDVTGILLKLDLNHYRNDTTNQVIESIVMAKEGVLNRISNECGGLDLLNPNFSDISLWNFYNAVFFAFTILTTIGYGQISPTDDYGRLFVILYGLIGIPLNLIFLNELGSYFSSKFVKAHKRSKENPTEWTLTFTIIFYLIPCLIAFIILPSFVFTTMESWSFFDSIYYSFVTLTTIGFGDFVAGKGNGDSVGQWVYQAFIMIWIIFGLSYIMMILSFIAKGIMHKKLRKMLEKHVTNIQSTKEELSKDVATMSHLINELYMIRIKNIVAAENQKSVNVQKKYPNGLTDANFNDKSYLDNDINQIDEIKSLASTPNSLRRNSNPNLNPNGGHFQGVVSQDGLIPDELYATVVDVLSQDMMQEMLKTVDKLNELQEQGGDFDDEERDYFANNLESNYTKRSLIESEMSRKYSLASDIETQLMRDNLERVVIEGQHSDLNKIYLGGSLIEKVHNAVRKISSSTCSDGPSRRISKNEIELMRRTPTSSSRKESQAGPSRGGSCASFDGRTSENLPENPNLNEPLDLAHHVETLSLVNLLESLDKVYEKLQVDGHNVTPTGRRRAQIQMKLEQGIGMQSPRKSRQRKLGICHEDYKTVSKHLDLELLKKKQKKPP